MGLSRRLLVGRRDVSVPVINPLSQAPVVRSFEGAGTLIQISDIPAVSNLTVQTITIIRRCRCRLPCRRPPMT